MPYFVLRPVFFLGLKWAHEGMHTPIFSFHFVSIDRIAPRCSGGSLFWLRPCRVPRSVLSIAPAANAGMGTPQVARKLEVTDSQVRPMITVFSWR